MNYTTLTSSSLETPIHCPTSKSYANRSLIIGALKQTKMTFRDLPDAQDVVDLIKILKQINVEMNQEGSSLSLETSFPECELEANSPILLSGSEGGTTIRFILPLLALGQNEYHLPLLGRMGERPLEELCELLRSLGAFVNLEKKLVKIRGPIKIPHQIKIDCSKTTQFATALLNLKAKYDFKIDYLNLNSSKKYIEMSEYLVKLLENKNEFSIPPDFSSLGYILAYSFFNQDMFIENVNCVDPFQADSFLIEILEQMGAKLSFENDGLKICQTSERPSGFSVDGSSCIDLVPTLMFIAAFCCSKSTISNVRFLEHKECNRLLEMKEILTKFKVRFEYDETGDIFTILPYQKNQEKLLRGLKVLTANDHRMVMVTSLFLKQHGGGAVAPMESVFKSFPNFFTLFK